MEIELSREQEAAKRFAAEFGADRVVVFYTRPGGEYDSVGYGTGATCQLEASRVASGNCEIIGMELYEA